MSALEKQIIERQDELIHAAISVCIERTIRGRTMVNFQHVPEIVRALEWVWMDLQSITADEVRERAAHKPETKA